MKRLLYISLVVFSMHMKMQASDPIIDYAKINAWCASVNLTSSELALFQQYLQSCKTLADQCVIDPNFVNTPQAKEILAEIGADIAQFLKDDALKNTFNLFQQLLNEELKQNPSTSKNYAVMSIVYAACLACL